MKVYPYVITDERNNWLLGVRPDTNDKEGVVGFKNLPRIGDMVTLRNSEQLYEVINVDHAGGKNEETTLHLCRAESHSEII